MDDTGVSGEKTPAFGAGDQECKRRAEAEGRFIAREIRPKK